jgi:hypothetical protein
LPTIYVLGLFTFVRLVQSVAEDFQYGRAINRIRHHYLELAGDQAHLFMMSAHDDAIGVLANMGIKHSARQAYFTTPSMGAVINSVVGGSAIAIAIGAIGDPPRGAAATIGGWWRSSLWRRCAASRPAICGPGLVSSRSSSPRRRNP